MLVLNNRADMERALKLKLPSELWALLAVHIDHTTNAQLEALTRIIVVRAVDEINLLNRELGFSLLWDIDGNRWNADNFLPRHDWIEAAGSWFVAISCAGDTGFANIILIETRGDELGEFALSNTAPRS